MRLRHVVRAAIVSLVLLVGHAGPASASCALDERPLEERIEETSMVLVGTVTATAHGDTTANLRVEEVWKGSTALREVVIQGGSGQDGMATSVDRSWTVGERYLVFPRPEGAGLVDNACSATTVWSDDLSTARPANATFVDATPATSIDGGWGAAESLLAGLVLAGLAAGSTWVVRRRRAAA